MISKQKSEGLEPGHEMVFTVTDHWNGPLKGIANFQGKPQFYERIFDTDQDDYSDMYRLTPIDDRTFRLAMEAWEIWRRWEVAFHADKVKIETHPALPGDMARHRELKSILDEVLRSRAEAIIQKGKFSVFGESKLPRGARRLQVKWTDP